ncbi:MAG: LapA family protein [Nevskiales bacterium]|nr:LapA family protein [Nevskiales bacterium]
MSAPSIRPLWRILTAVLLVVVLVVGGTVGYFNADPVRFDYLFGVWQAPLFAILFAAFALGVLVSLLVASLRILRLRMDVRRLRGQVRDRESELSNLRGLSMAQDRGVS